MLLDLRGHDVRAVMSGFAAFHHVPEFTPDVCLIDTRLLLGSYPRAVSRRLMVRVADRN